MKHFPIAFGACVGLIFTAGCESSSTPTSPPSAVVRPQTFTLSGIVSEGAGTGVVPVGGALVRETRSQRSATTDNDGRYSIAELTAGGRSVTVSKAGYVSFTSNLDMSGDATLNVSVAPVPTYVLSGVVFEVTVTGRRTVEGVNLYCDSCGSPVGHTFTLTDARGRYEFAWSMNGRHDLQVWKDGYALVRRDGILGKDTGYVSAAVNGDTQLDIEVERR